MQEYTKKIPTILLVLTILGSVFFSGLFLGKASIPDSRKVTNLLNIENGAPDDIDFSAFWQAWNLIEEKYVPRQNGTTTIVTTEDKVYGAIQGLARSLGDPYTMYFPPEDAKIFAEDINGNFEGVGMEIGIRDGILTIISPLEGSPAKQAGLLSGDQIIGIDGASTIGINIDTGVKLIRGEKGTAVKLTIIRDGKDEPLEIEVVRDVINIPTLDSNLRDDGIYVIRLFNFNRDSGNEFRMAIREMVSSGSNKLILDLRSNPGGFLSVSVDMASWFLPTGKVVVQEDFGNSEDNQMYRSKGYNVFDSNLEMIVLIDQGSASASEILAGALSEHGIATLVGFKTFGKGSVQQLESIGEGSLKVTVARWLTPNGNSISENGLDPDVEVKYDIESPDVDNQMDKAIELLNN